jgi:predicted RNase H-like HicB family nuclease
LFFWILHRGTLNTKGWLKAFVLMQERGEPYYVGVSGGDSPIKVFQKVKFGLTETIVPRRFTVVVTKEAEGGFSAYSPDIPGARTQGETEDELDRNMAEAVELVLEARGESVPFVLILTSESK